VFAAVVVLVLSGIAINWNVEAVAESGVGSSEVMELSRAEDQKVQANDGTSQEAKEKDDGTSQEAKEKDDGTSQVAKEKDDGTSQVAKEEDDGTSQEAKEEDDGTSQLAVKAHAKAEFALNTIKTAKELRSKARSILKVKGKPVPEILQKGALDDVHKRVLSAQAKLTAKFGAGTKDDGVLEARVQAKREAPLAAKSNAQNEQLQIEKQAAEKKATMYKDKFQEEERKTDTVTEKAKAKETALQQKATLDKALQKTANDGKVMELEVKMKEKAKEKMAAAPAEDETDFNHRQIAQEAYNKQVMGYVMSWEQTHGGPMQGQKQQDEQKAIKSHLQKFVDHYEQKHADIKSDIAVADTPTE